MTHSFILMKWISQDDLHLIQIVEAATLDAAQRSGDWMKCRRGCTQCCIGVFAINQLDALRLRQGLANLEQTDPARAAAVHRRVEHSIERLAPEFPGDSATGILDDSDPAFEDFANDERCPVLDPATGTCDLYSARPMTCRVFGHPIRSEEGIGICELCFDGASESEILAAELKTDWTGFEESLNEQAQQEGGTTGITIIAFALRSRPAL